MNSYFLKPCNLFSRSLLQVQYIEAASAQNLQVEYVDLGQVGGAAGLGVVDEHGQLVQVATAPGSGHQGRGLDGQVIQIIRESPAAPGAEAEFTNYLQTMQIQVETVLCRLSVTVSYNSGANEDNTLLRAKICPTFEGWKVGSII